tara:strand:- start:7970 stop:8737 length:768 start_codon:yes stop_codon:yes gene_type:complete
MSYTTNINQIDSELKKVFTDVLIDNSDFRQLNIKLSNPINEETNKLLEMKLFVSQTNLNNINPILEWGYYADPTELDNLIKFRTASNSLSTAINEVIKHNRLSKDYLNSIEETKLINEGLDTEEVEDEITNINQTYELSESRLNLNVSKFKKYLETVHGLTVDKDDIILEHRDVNSGKIRKPSFVGSNSAVMGDESEVLLAGISSLNHNGNITPANWLTLETAIRKIPFVADINSSTYNYSCTFNFSTKVFVELV